MVDVCLMKEKCLILIFFASGMSGQNALLCIFTMHIRIYVGSKKKKMLFR